MIRRLLGGLQFRLILLTLLVLFPLGLIALAQTYQVVQETRSLNERRLLDITSVAAAGQRARVKQAIGAGTGLGAAVRATDLQTCRAIMQEFIAANPGYALAGFIQVDGQMACTNAGDTVYDFSGYERLQDAIERAEVYVEVNASGAVSGQAVVIVSVPVFDGAQLTGFVSLSLPQETVTIKDDADDGVVLTALATSGEVFGLVSDGNDPQAALPAAMSNQDLAARADTTFWAEDQSGQQRMFSVMTPVADSYLIVGRWDAPGAQGASLWRVALMPVLFAVLMWMGSMSVAYVGLERLVLRHLRDLRSAMRQLALGDRSQINLDLQGAPEEFKDAERAFRRMALLITEAEARQLTDLHDKEVLLREVHHRVKNNLQMIASIMNLQARAARTDEVREVLAGLQRRVRGLAMLHRSLYTQPESSQVDARDLIETVIAETSALLPDPALRIEADLTSALLYPDQAVPLSMWVTEALTNAVKYAGRNEAGALAISVALTHDGDGRVTLRIENTIGDGIMTEEAEAESTGLGSRLMIAFCRQLEGEADVQTSQGRYALSLQFRVEEFDQGAARLGT